MADFFGSTGVFTPFTDPAAFTDALLSGTFTTEQLGALATASEKAGLEDLAGVVEMILGRDGISGDISPEQFAAAVYEVVASNAGAIQELLANIAAASPPSTIRFKNREKAVEAAAAFLATKASHRGVRLDAAAGANSRPAVRASQVSSPDAMHAISERAQNPVPNAAVAYEDGVRLAGDIAREWDAVQNVWYWSKLHLFWGAAKSRILLTMNRAAANVLNIALHSFNAGPTSYDTLVRIIEALDIITNKNPDADIRRIDAKDFHFSFEKQENRGLVPWKRLDLPKGIEVFVREAASWGESYEGGEMVGTPVTGEPR